MANAKKITLVESKPDDYTCESVPCQGFFEPFTEKVINLSGEQKAGTTRHKGSRLF
jgi:hypothetical protein